MRKKRGEAGGREENWGRAPIEMKAPNQNPKYASNYDPQRKPRSLHYTPPKFTLSTAARLSRRRTRMMPEGFLGPKSQQPVFWHGIPNMKRFLRQTSISTAKTSITLNTFCKVSFASPIIIGMQCGNYRGVRGFDP